VCENSKPSEPHTVALALILILLSVFISTFCVSVMLVGCSCRLHSHLALVLRHPQGSGSEFGLLVLRSCRAFSSLQLWYIETRTPILSYSFNQERACTLL
jgi:hypothetical protein